MEKILIIGASQLQLPAIKKAKELGLYVAVADFNPKAVGIPFADEYFNVSTIDIDGIIEVAKKFRPDGIMTLATDMPMRSIAAACSELNLPSISMETAIKATDKGEMIKAFKENDVPSPWFFIVKSAEELESIRKDINYPCIMKPTDNSGSRGVVLVENEKKLGESFAYSVSQSREGGVIIEEYLKGDEVSVEIMVTDGEVNIIAITDKLTTGAPHFVEMGHSQPTHFEGRIKENIIDVATRAVKAVGILNGPAHVEIMVTENGAKMIELGARLGGDCITTHLVPLSTGVDLVEATLCCALKKPPDLKLKSDKGSAIRYFDVPEGKIKSIKGVEEAKKISGIKEITFVRNVGDDALEIDSSSARMGFVISQSETAQGAIEICEKAIDMVRIEIL